MDEKNSSAVTVKNERTAMNKQELLEAIEELTEQMLIARFEENNDEIANDLEDERDKLLHKLQLIESEE